jgi:hypothetical protein
LNSTAPKAAGAGRSTALAFLHKHTHNGSEEAMHHSFFAASSSSSYLIDLVAASAGRSTHLAVAADAPADAQNKAIRRRHVHLISTQLKQEPGQSSGVLRRTH